MLGTAGGVFSHHGDVPHVQLFSCRIAKNCGREKRGKRKVLSEGKVLVRDVQKKNEIRKLKGENSVGKENVRIRDKLQQ